MVAAPAPGVTFSVSMLTLTEASAGRTGTYTVVLDSEPTADVTVTVMGADTSIATIDTNTNTPAVDNTLTFTPSGGAAPWDVEQRVTVTAIDNMIDDPSDRTITLTHTATGGGYNRVTNALVVTITDDDMARLTITTPSPNTITEDNSADTHSATYTVVLNSQPAGDVMVTPMADSGAISVSGTLTFTDLDWRTPKPVTINAREDDNAIDEMVTITHTVTSTDDTVYNALTSLSSVTVAVTDNDTAGVTISTSAVTAIEEGTNGTYTRAPGHRAFGYRRYYSE